MRRVKIPIYSQALEGPVSPGNMSVTHVHNTYHPTETGGQGLDINVLVVVGIIAAALVLSVFVYLRRKRLGPPVHKVWVAGEDPLTLSSTPPVAAVDVEQ